MSSTVAGSTMTSSPTKSAPDDKVTSDLKTLTEQINLCSDMLRESHGQINPSNEALLGVVGFLEACAPRMVELIEAAAQGVLKESTLMRCLEVNDRLLKVLSDCDEKGDGKSAFTDTAAAASGSDERNAAAMAKAKSDLDLDLDDLLLDDNPRNRVNKSEGDGQYQRGADSKKAAEADFTIDDDADGAGTPGKGAAEAPKKGIDDFDNFFRTG